jgi:hypothetical protein
MEIFRNSNGYVPLLVNLEPYFDKPFAELPDEAKAMLHGTLLNPTYLTKQELATFSPELREILEESIPKPLLLAEEEFARLPDPVQQYLNRTCLTEVHLTDELKTRIERAYPNANDRTQEITLFLELFHQVPWDHWSAEHRRFLAAAYDNGHDPRHESDAYFHLFFLEEELKKLIEGARRDGKDSVIVVLRDIQDRVREIMKADRERVTAVNEQIREAQSNKRRGSTSESTYLLIIYALKEYLVSGLPGEAGTGLFKSQAKLIEALEQHYPEPEYRGMKQRTLQTVFAQANQAFQER